MNHRVAGIVLILAALNGMAVAQNATNVGESREARIEKLIAEIARSGRFVNNLETKPRLADPRKSVAPGAPPLLSFRYFAGADRHRFGKLDVMMDDAGH